VCHGPRPKTLLAALRPDGPTLVEDFSLSTWALDELDRSLTTCAAACADTGTFALAGRAGQGRRALSLVPDEHVCVVRAEKDRGNDPRARDG